MKARKALKRLTKIETLLSDVTQRYAAGATHLREVLQAAKTAVAQAKLAVGLPPVKAKQEPVKPKRKARTARKKAAVKKAAANAPTAKKTKKSAPIKKAVKKRAKKKTAPAPLRAATAVAVQEPMPVPPWNDRSDPASDF
jgi:hypothetical protein